MSLVGCAPEVRLPDRMDSDRATLVVDRKDAEAVVNLIERAIGLLRDRWNTMPVNETDAFVRLRELVDHG